MNLNVECYVIFLYFCTCRDVINCIKDVKSDRIMKTKHIMYRPTGVCSQVIDVTADENNVIQQVFFIGGCNGNLQGISSLVKGQKIPDVISKLQGIRCGTKRTSCPDQLCQALQELMNTPLE